MLTPAFDHSAPRKPTHLHLELPLVIGLLQSTWQHGSNPSISPNGAQSDSGQMSRLSWATSCWTPEFPATTMHTLISPRRQNESNPPSLATIEKPQNLAQTNRGPEILTRAAGPSRPPWKSGREVQSLLSRLLSANTAYGSRGLHIYNCKPLTPSVSLSLSLYIYMHIHLHLQ